MPQKTNLNINPFFDDFDKDDNFYRVLFKPGFPVQARELTTLQTLLQDQIDTFGQGVYKEGSITWGHKDFELVARHILKCAKELEVPLDSENKRKVQVKSQLRAPSGGIEIHGDFYSGGRFIPAEVQAKMTEEEKDAIREGKLLVEV